MRGQKLLLALSIAVAAIGFVGLIYNIRAALQSPSEASTRSISEEAQEQSAPAVAPAAENPQTSSATSLPPTKPFRSKQELAELLKKSQEESQVCKANVTKARAILSKSLMSAEEFKHALRLLEETHLTPPSSQEVFLAFEEGNPSEWDGPAFLEEVMSAGGCDTVIHYKLLKSIVEKAAKRPERFPREQIRSAVKAFLTLGAEKPSPMVIELTRIALLKDLVQDKEIDAAFEQRVMELQQMAQGLSDKIQEDVRACQNASDCLKSLPNEFEQSKRVREAYLRLIKEIWPN